MPKLAEARSANATFSPSYIPTAVFVGGTNGIGAGMAKAFAHHTNGNAHIIIIGRNQAAAESVIASFPKPSATHEPHHGKPLHEFIHCDAVLMKNVEVVTKGLLETLEKINFLVLSPGFLNVRGRDETEEGIDKSIALSYYARFKFIHDLQPLLVKAKDAKEDAKVLSVLAAGQGGPIDLTNLGIKTGYGFSSVTGATPTYNDLMLESFAAQQPEISFIHAYPGIVSTGILWLPLPWYLSPLAVLVYVTFYLKSITPETSAEYLWYGVFQSKGGFHRKGEKGVDIGRKRYHGSDEAREALWDHTVKAITVGE